MLITARGWCTSTLRTLACVTLTFGLVACSESDTETRRQTGTSGTGGGIAEPDRHNVAGQCIYLKSAGQYLAKNAGSYTTTADPADAAAFYMKATRLGAYLLLSDFQRVEGEAGTKELLGIADPFGEVLDAAGNGANEGGYQVSGAGDASEYFSDPVLLPAIGASGMSDSDTPRARDPGEGVSEAGQTLASQNAMPALAMLNEASDQAVWVLDEVDAGGFTLATDVTAQYLTADSESLGLTAPEDSDSASIFEIQVTQGCAAYPEAELNAVVAAEGPAVFLSEVPFFAEREFEQGDIYGFVDAHSHISAYEFIGGRINYGDPFHKFGVDHALGNCEENHGPQGMVGLTEQVVSEPGPHDTEGWPSYNYWPRNNSKLHHQSYYKWLERGWLAGMKVHVNHLVHNEILCQIVPQKERDCDAMPAIELQAERMYEMQDYIDAQSGGPGQGWFRIVTNPAQARQVIEDGQMAVILGVEMSKVLNCGEYQDVAECTETQVVERLDRLYDMGVRSIFPVHKFDNAFAGHLPDLGNPVGIAGVLYVGNFAETGHPIEFETCPEEEYVGDEPEQGRPNYVQAPDPGNLQEFGLIDQMLFQLDYLGKVFPDAPEGFEEFDARRGTGEHCNSRGLTPLGEFLIDEVMKRRMFIETDHISRKAAARVLEITGSHGYPVVNSHGGWGGTDAIRDRITNQGGMANSFARGDRNGWVDTLRKDGGRPRADVYKVAGCGPAGFASDVNGIANLPGQPGDEDPALYPFTSLDGRVLFDVQKTGDQRFGIYDGRGVAHYGLYPDLIEDMSKNSERSPEEVDEALCNFFTSAEGYLRMWERMEAADLGE